ncbi:pyridoxamine 5'-phosphate oxidase family protein [Pseudonocardia alaniniphila]|uniref:Pyridoxamine 5'-phosphate oxidase family protein n=1 Tax=Pseudonocardia alaniniphila TaxID=75291 RepID=A0ABS9T7M8_9PSEU|nr:pyridoxamine 5'-phosphate oxidase family protein [Pseudonocardia alaniniphila]MCH6164532.1 pyridoxamine 5'-phosphate oxidase family protein [Pseudonocardia alaniniphila]
MAVGESVDAGTAADEARRVVAANTYMTLATADADGRPWATPVWFAALDCADFVWVSRPGARHSANIAGRAAVGIVVFDSTVAVGEAAAVYVEAEAEEVGPGDRAAALAVYNGRTQKQGIGSWSERDVSGAAQFRIYRARTTRVYVLDEHDGRVEVAR